MQVSDGNPLEKVHPRATRQRGLNLSRHATASRGPRKPTLSLSRPATDHRTGNLLFISCYIPSVPG
ncbi:hypothetical protein HanPI659440_Chr04g0179061 [Helianthus annuus]|nr:hypothetical protein HanPI659440_Chr04g0179061 [Helianthus annuus]